MMRFFAEAAWYPDGAAAQPGRALGGRDDRSAYATLEEGDITLTMLFTFDEQGLIDTVHAEARGRAVAARSSRRPGRATSGTTRARRYAVPLDGEVAWLLPEGEKPYWRGHITEIRYQSAR
jgi:hypothetical protein